MNKTYLHPFNFKFIPLNDSFSFNASNEFAFYLVPDSRIENDFLSQSISHNAPIGKTVIGV